MLLGPGADVKAEEERVEALKKDGIGTVKGGPLGKKNMRKIPNK